MLTNEDKLILKTIADNQTLFELVKKIVKVHFKLDITKLPIGMTNEQIGAYVLTRAEGLKMVENAFKEIASHKSNAPQLDKKNPGY